MRVAALSLVLFVSSGSATTIDWSVPVQEALESVPINPSQARSHVLPSGSAFLIGGGSVGRAVSVQLSPAGAVQPGQFGYQPIGADSVYADQILDATSTALVIRYETSSGSTAEIGTAKITSTGELIWATPRFSRYARLLADGDVLSIQGSSLQRLRSADGSVRWTRNLFELHPDAVDVVARLADGSGTAVVALDVTSVRPPQYPAPLLYAFNTETGATLWQT